MKDERKTTVELTEELSELRKRIRELEALEKELNRAETALRRERGKFEGIVASLGDGLDVVGTDYRIHFQNEMLQKRFGDVTGKLCYRVYVGRETPCENCPMVAAIASSSTKRTEVTGADGRDYEITSTPFEDIDGVVKAIEVVRDITERKRAEKALRESEERYAKAEQTGHFGHWDRSLDEDRATWSKEACRILGFEPDKLPSYEDYLKVVYSGDREALKAATDAAMSGVKPVDCEYRIIRPDGTERVIHSVAEVRYDKSGQPVGLLGTVHDITERKRAEKALRQERDNLLRIFTAMEDGVYIVDQQYDIQYVNPALVEDFGPWEGRKCYEYYHDRTEVCPWCKNERVFAGETVRWEWYSFKNDRTYDLIDTPLINPDGSIHKLEIFRDITKSKRAEEALRESEEHLNGLYENTPIGLYRTTPEGRIVMANSALVRMLGYDSLEQLMERNLSDEGYEPDYPREEFQERLEREGVIQALKCAWKRNDGTTVYVRESARVIRDEKGRSLYYDGSAEDITDLVQAEEERRESEALLQSLFDTMIEGVIFIAPDGQIVQANPAAERILGLRRSKITERDYVAPNWNIFRPDGTLMPQEEMAGPRAMKEKRPVKDVEMGVEKPDGSVNWINVSAAPIIDKTGELRGAVGVFGDITDSKRAKLQLEASRQQMQALSARVLAAQEEERTRISREIHDELAQTLTALAFDLAWLDNRLPEKDVAVLNKVKTMNERIGETISAVQRISTELRPGILDDLGLSAAVEWYLRDFQERTGITCDLRITPEDIILDTGRCTTVFRIFQEALTNTARHADATKVRVKLQEEPGKLLLEVCDDGRGITAEQASSGKSLGPTGMRERARLWNGSVTIKGTEGKGTTVLVEIPLDGPSTDRDAK